ncbi:MAG: hypothetical protein BWX81_01542 [Spirochaetes bacterium ADurb.Bin110]|nr:MAG: hypothetical protein BWX81_01542 [Spirochaetes bacterium ADurb.Bin110]
MYGILASAMKLVSQSTPDNITILYQSILNGMVPIRQAAVL